MIILRADHKIDRRLPAHDFGALRLGDAAGDDDSRFQPRGPAFLLELADLAQF